MVRFQPSTDTIATTQVVGTMVYMSPECAQGQVTPASDVYAFGVVSNDPSAVCVHID